MSRYIKRETEINRENMKSNVNTENLTAKPSKARQVFSTKLLYWSLRIVFGNCLLFGAVLFLLLVQSKMANLEKDSVIEKDPVSNTKSKSGNGSIVDMVSFNSSSLALNTSNADLNSDARATIIRQVGKSYICNKDT